MGILLGSFIGEVKRIGKSPWLMLLLFGVPLGIIVAIVAMVSAGVARNFPIVLVDNDNSTLSRKIIDNLNASPNAKIIARTPNLEDAKSMLRSQDAMVIVYIPQDTQKNFTRGNIRPVYIFYNAAFLSTGGLAMDAAQKAVSAAIEDATIEQLHKRGLPEFRMRMLRVNSTILYNAQTSFEWYFQALIIPASLHLFIGCMVAISSLRAFGLLDGEDCGEIYSNPFAMLLNLIGRAMPYVIVVTLYACAWLVWIVGFKGWQVEGSIGAIVCGLWLLYMGTAAISIYLICLLRDAITTMSFSAVYAGSAIAYSGGTLPLNGGSKIAEVWSKIIPYTHYLNLQMDQFLGAPFSVAMPQIAILSLYTIIPLILCVPIIWLKGRNK